MIKQVAKGAGGPTDKGKGPGRMGSAAQDGHGRAGQHLHAIDREGHRVQVFDKNLTYIREIANEWNPWDIGISRKGTDGYAFIADHMLERVHKMQLEGRQARRDMGHAGTRPRRVRLGPRHRRRLQGRRLRRRHLRSALQKFVPSNAARNTGGSVARNIAALLDARGSAA